MSTARRCAAAIWRCGGQGLLLQGEQVFPLAVCVRPRREEEAAGATLGLGGAAWYTLFLPCGSKLPAVGDCVQYAGERYHIQQIQTRHCAGQAVYHWAVARRETPAPG